ncbi:MAG: hypothetical protein BWZ05_01071 [Bacteroidetes bacterium ADurb.BinA245]|jgi:hypothetical protein|nr:hypothetical protein [Chitinophagaceae bacterium]OPZ18012.1 MAG: hypothetical protein BWZ05_01071 [Bacteroidetes bacterium ADurb.BinA245]HMW66103.1 hypothetical protein [Chitinophagaceae bacterium]HNA92450.1 hypothetical protein [Chitinophagaceae bacterium]HRF24941.1 hypothetical protein [Chitinophagaceae bacterium]
MRTKATVIMLCTILLLACGQNRNTKPAWEIIYKRLDEYLGNVEISIGTHSCFFQNNSGIQKNASRIKWKSSPYFLKDLYENFSRLQLNYCNTDLLPASNEPVETLILLKEGQIEFRIVRAQQNINCVKKFDSALILLKTFVFAQNNGYKY